MNESPRPSPHSSPFRVVGLGELLWDVYPDRETLGGAPANFASHCRALGAEAAIVSAVGADTRGDRALELLGSRGLDLSGISRVAAAPTGIVLVTLDGAGKPEYEIASGAAWDSIPWSSRLEEIAAAADAVCFGSLAQRSTLSRETIRRFLAAVRPGCLRVFDINLRSPYYNPAVVIESLGVADVLKLSDEELPLLTQWLGLRGGEEEQLSSIAGRFGLRLAVLTRGARGARMISRSESSLYVPPAVDVRSTVGAGDAFTAAAILGFLRGRTLAEVNRHANAVAAYVCSRQEAVPPLPAELV